MLCAVYLLLSVSRNRILLRGQPGSRYPQEGADWASSSGRAIRAATLHRPWGSLRTSRAFHGAAFGRSDEITYLVGKSPGLTPHQCEIRIHEPLARESRQRESSRCVRLRTPCRSTMPR